jgi:hypothetical protein
VVPKLQPNIENNQKENDDKKMDLTILVDGNPVEKEYPSVLRVEEVIKSLLPPGEKNQWTKYQLSDRTRTLNPKQSLLENGVKDHDTLSLTQTDGGGGLFDR